MNLLDFGLFLGGLSGDIDQLGGYRLIPDGMGIMIFNAQGLSRRLRSCSRLSLVLGFFYHAFNCMTLHRSASRRIALRIPRCD